MIDPELIKSWRITVGWLRQASASLQAWPRVPSADLKEYEDFLSANELELAMLELEDLAREYGAEAEFWRALERAARQMQLQDKVPEYRSEFRRAHSAESPRNPSGGEQ